MEKMFVSPENSTNDAAESFYDSSEPMRSKSATASYRCKLYRAHLQQGAASRFIALQFPAQPKNAVAARA